jgi:hypothetical protein
VLAAAALAAGLVAWGPRAAAQEAPEGALDLPLPRSIEVRVPGAHVRTSPAARGSKRGTLAFGARLAPLESRRAAGCEREWYRIGDEAWVCGESVARRGSEPAAQAQPVLQDGAIVPDEYGFARQDGARYYATLDDIDADEWEVELDPGTGLHLRRQVTHEGRAYQRLAKGGYVAAEEVRPARPSRYAGVRVEGGDAAAFVWGQPAPVRSGAGRGAVARRLGRRQGFAVLERSTVGRALWLRLGPDAWVAARGLRLAEPVEPPPAVAEGERWIHVDRARQILTAYEGRRMVYATLVSTGREGSATPAGTFRIWAKLATGVMNDEGETIDDRPYEMQGVPWVMYFNEGVALHGAYWHDGFGRSRSHGCVNLAPVDAAWVFDFTRPALPPGWTGVLPTSADRGSLVVVR